MEGIFYSEFDNITGPTIRFQHPEGCLSNDVFDTIASYIITEEQLCGSVVTVNAFGYKIMGFPLCIRDEKYGRNALLFNIGFVFHEDADLEPFQPVLRKLGNSIMTLEIDTGFLFKADSKAKLRSMLPDILHNINTFGECSIPVDLYNAINLRTFTRLPDPPAVFDHQVRVARPPLSCQSSH
jgi:hypothetical protein